MKILFVGPLDEGQISRMRMGSLRGNPCGIKLEPHSYELKDLRNSKKSEVMALLFNIC